MYRKINHSEDLNPIQTGTIPITAKQKGLLSGFTGKRGYGIRVLRFMSVFFMEDPLSKNTSGLS